ncbi:MAG: helix-turn-helix domain-containing protein [Thermotogota bacterium]|nr:helix-turn-helix domain-containing protein [Thermotogota bacterium]
MYYHIPPECTGKEFRARITEGRVSSDIVVPAVIHALVKGVALEYLVQLGLDLKGQTLMLYLINTGSLSNNETIDVLSENTKLSRPSVIGALNSLVKKDLLTRKRKGGDKTNISPFIGKMLQFKKVSDVRPHELEDLMDYFGNDYKDPVLALQELISKLFSINPEPPLARFLRVCLLAGFDERTLEDDTVKAIIEVVSSSDFAEERLLQTAIFGEKSWKKIIPFYQEKSIPINEEYTERINNIVNEIERLIQSPKKVIDGLVGKDDGFYKELANVFPNQNYVEMRESERLDKVACLFEETEDKVKELLDRFVL